MIKPGKRGKDNLARASAEYLAQEEGGFEAVGWGGAAKGQVSNRVRGEAINWGGGGVPLMPPLVAAPPLTIMLRNILLDKNDVGTSKLSVFVCNK